jgi:hypothetical protein
MPIIWGAFSTASTPEVHERREDPRALRDYVAGVVDRAGATLEDLYFEAGAERACALIVDLDDYINLKAVAGVLGFDHVTKLLNVDQAVEARKREGDFRDGSSSAGA